MANPSWANADITKLLPEIRAGGEGPSYEFKEDFPPQGHELSKEVAAFATAGGGLILIGVRDDGSVVGLNENDRDQLRLRAQNIVSHVQPRPKLDVTPCFDEGFVLVICVRNDQEEPVYYYDHRPYIRDGSQSRPATPDEVKGRVLAHPSADHKKRMEDLNYEIAKSVVEQSNKRTAEADEISLKAMAAQNELLLQSRQRFLDRK